VIRLVGRTAFVAGLTAALGRPPGSIGATTALADLALDEFEQLVLAVWAEGLLPGRDLDADAHGAGTVADLHALYAQRAVADAFTTPPAPDPEALRAR
jgi:hypothetical protein